MLEMTGWGSWSPRWPRAVGGIGIMSPYYLKGHDFSRADKANKMNWALAPAGWLDTEGAGAFRPLDTGIKMSAFRPGPSPCPYGCFSTDSRAVPFAFPSFGNLGCRRET